MSKSKSKTKNFFKKLFPYNSSCSKISKSQIDDFEPRLVTKPTIVASSPGDSEDISPKLENGTPLPASITHINEPCMTESDKLASISDGINRIDVHATDAQNYKREISSGDAEVDGKCLDKCGEIKEMIHNNGVEHLKADGTISSIQRNESNSSWGKIRAALVWIPFIQQCSKYQYPWIQIAGHQGNFKPGEQGTVLKKHCGRESICLQTMCKDILADFVPSFKGDVYHGNEQYICMEDLLTQFRKPSLMDIKMGTRTYLEEELGKMDSCCPKPRQDMYEKMMAIDKDEPTEEEHRVGAVIKSRYMQWRESLSSSFLLGFRIEGIKKSVGTQSRDYKRTRERLEVKESLLDFVDKDAELTKKFITRLKNLRTNLLNSNFFWEHEFIGSSLLFVHDKSGKANIWMIDFGKTMPLPPTSKVDHTSPWIEGNHEDGYLFGLNNLLILLLEIHSDISNNSC